MLVRACRAIKSVPKSCVFFLCGWARERVGGLLGPLLWVKSNTKPLVLSCRVSLTEWHLRAERKKEGVSLKFRLCVSDGAEMHHWRLTHQSCDQRPHDVRQHRLLHAIRRCMWCRRFINRRVEWVDRSCLIGLSSRLTLISPPSQPPPLSGCEDINAGICL